MKTPLLIILGVILAGMLVRIFRVVAAKDSNQKILMNKQLSWISLGLLLGYMLYLWALHEVPDSISSYTPFIGIVLLTIQGGRFIYKYMQLKKLKKEAGLFS